MQAVSLLHENLLWGPFEDGGDSYDSLSPRYVGKHVETITLST